MADVNIYDRDQIYIPTNKFQTPITRQLLDSLPDEVVDWLLECLQIPFIKNLISPNRPYPKDLEKDSIGRCIIDLANPPIIENTDFFRPAALHFMEHGCYSKLKPNANPNSPYGKYLRTELNRCWGGMLRSDGLWISGQNYWYLNYEPMQINTQVDETKNYSDRSTGFPRFWEGVTWRYWYLDQARFGGIYNNFKGGEHACEISSRGKAHPYSQEVYTPSGKVLWKDIKIGDILFGDDGKTTKVVDIPFDKEDDVYKITLKDGRIVYASGGHLWKIMNRNSKGFRIVSTKDMINNLHYNRSISYKNPKGIEYNYRIPSNKGVEWEYSKTMIDPYTFGLLLGDRCFTQDDEDMDAERKHIPYDIVKWSYKCSYKIYIDEWRPILKEYGLIDKKSEEKFIPDEYKYNSRNVRISILKGLMDSDGSVDNNGIPIIGSASKRLADDIEFIARSLGYNCLRSVRKCGYRKDGEYMNCLDSYVVRILTSDRIFNLDRKQNLVSSFKSSYSRSNRDSTSITNIEFSHREKCKCVTVDNESHCYLIGEFVTTHNSKSYSLAGIGSHNLIVGENERSHKGCVSILVADSKEYLNIGSDGTLNKLDPILNHLSKFTQFPRRKIIESQSKMTWQMGYRDRVTGAIQGSRNTLAAVPVKGMSDKLRGKRGMILFEEFGTFTNLLSTYNSVRDSVEEGGIAFAQIYLLGTSGNKDSDFSGARELVTSPIGYRIYALPNVFSKNAAIGDKISFFFPSYVNYGNKYNKDGVSDVVGALIEILMDRYTIKYNSKKPESLNTRIAERCITPEEALIKVHSTIFPINDINERKKELMFNQNSLSCIKTGEFVFDSNNKIAFASNGNTPIREFPCTRIDTTGAIEMKEEPIRDSEGKVQYGRYLAGMDPYDQDKALHSTSLGSWYIMDSFTEELVCWYTGRPSTSDIFYEQARRALLYYNAIINCENNKIGFNQYMKKMNCMHMICETLSIVKARTGYKPSSQSMNLGTYSTKGVNVMAIEYIDKWFKKSRVITDAEGNDVEVNNIKTIYDIGLLQEAALYDGVINCDRISAMGMLMLLVADRNAIYGDNMERLKDSRRSNAPKDQFLCDNYDSFRDDEL